MRGAAGSGLGRGVARALFDALTAAAETSPFLNGMGTPFLPVYAAEPEDIANAATFLVSDDARLITSEHLSIDQGMHMF